MGFKIKINERFKFTGIIIGVLAMLFAPTAAGLIMEGQAPTVEVVEDEKEGCQISVYMTKTGELTEMDIEDYVKGAMMCMISPDFDEETLKAAAVAIRSSAYVKTENDSMKNEHYCAVVCDDHLHCGGYIGLDEAKRVFGEEVAEEYYKKITDAVCATEGEVLYYEGDVIDAPIHTASYGVTESAYNLWGISLPYLVSVPTCESVELNSFKFTVEEFFDRLNSAEFLCIADGVDISVEVFKNENDRVKYVEINGQKVAGEVIRELFDLPSLSYDITVGVDGVCLEVYGIGHGVGMSLCGAEVLSGQGITYNDILSHYYLGTVVGLYA